MILFLDMQAEQAIDLKLLNVGKRTLLDRIGMIASTLCAIHCILMPWLLMIAPVLTGTIFTEAKLENVFVVFSIFLAGFCGFRGYLKHGKWAVMALIATGGATLTVVRMTAPAICCLDDISWTHATGSAFGGSLLATSHFLNLKYSRQVDSEENLPCCPSEKCSAHK